MLETVARVKSKKNDMEEKCILISCEPINFVCVYYIDMDHSPTHKFFPAVHKLYFLTLLDNGFRSFQLHHFFNLDNNNGAEDTPTLIDRKVKSI